MIWIMVLLLLLATPVNAAISLSVPDGCTVVKPGTQYMYLLTYTPEADGQRILRLVSNGMSVYPQEIWINALKGETYTYYISVTSPANVVDSYYTLVVEEYDATTSQKISEKQYCFRVYRGVSYEGAPHLVVGYKDISVKGDSIEIMLFVRNLGEYVEVVSFNSDYENVYFNVNPVIVPPFKEVEVSARIPIGTQVTIPRYVKIFATSGDITKEITVQLPVTDVYTSDISLSTPREVIVDTSIVFVPVLITNNSDRDITVYIKGKGLPLGVNVLSDPVRIPPGATVRTEAWITLDTVYDTGTFVSKLCAVDTYGAEIECKNVIITIPEQPESVSVVEQDTGKGKMVTITVEAGTERIYGGKVEVEAPEGWEVKVSPETIYVRPFGREMVTVEFVPSENAQGGTALITIKDSEGEIITTRTVELSPSPGTGFVTASTSSVIGAVILAAVLAVIAVTLLKRKKKEKESGIEEIEELLKKE